MLISLWLAVAFVLIVGLAYANAAPLAWLAVMAILIGAAWIAHLLPIWLLLAITVVGVLASATLLCSPLRRALVTKPLFEAFRKVLPPMSQTEREAIEA